MNAHLKKFIRSVRSGKWGDKADGTFFDGENYCILGALTKQYELETGHIMYENGEYIHDEDEDSLLDKVRKFFGLKEKCPQVVFEPVFGDAPVDLYKVNDKTSLSLQEIADLMAAQEESLCVKERPKKDKNALPPGAQRLPMAWVHPDHRVDYAITQRKKVTDDN